MEGEVSKAFRKAWVEIDLGSIYDNVTSYRRHISPNKALMAVVKGNAYGHGAVPVAKEALAAGAAWLAVALLEEALEWILGKGKFIIAYLLTGIIGNVGTLVFEAPFYTHLGASGALYGLLGFYFYMRFFRKDLIDPGSAQIVVTILFVGALYTIFFYKGINVLAHLFGFIGGTALAPLLLPKGRRRYL